MSNYCKVNNKIDQQKSIVPIEAGLIKWHEYYYVKQIININVKRDILS